MLLMEVIVLFVVSEKGTQMNRCGCIEHMDITAGELSAADAPVQVHLAAAFRGDTECNTARGKKEQSKFKYKTQAFLLLTAHYSNHIVHQGFPMS